MKPAFIIQDWAGNDLSYHHGRFKSFDDAEDALSMFLGDNYETDREEYYIVPASEARQKSFLDPRDPRGML